MIHKKLFGRTGHTSTRTLFGGAAFWEVTQYQADKILELLLKYGINHIDTAASYGDSELRIGPWMREYRNVFFLATKTGMRTYQEAKEEFYKSLDRLRVDSVDLLQMHVLINEQEWQTTFGNGGALEFFIEAKEQGLTKYLGVTGHGLAAPRMHLRSLDQYEFDSVLLPYNYILMQDPVYAQEFQALQEKCLEKNIAIQTIKSIARGPKDESMTQYTTWYEPITEQEAINDSVSWVLGNPNVFLNTVGDINILEKVLKAASNFSNRPDKNKMDKDINDFGITQLFTTQEI